MIKTALVLAFICFFLLQNYAFIKMDSEPKNSDGQLLRSLTFHMYIFQGIRFGGDQAMKYPYPPLTYLVSSIFLKFFGVSMLSSRLSLLFFMVVFLLAMFGTGYEYGGYLSGLAVMSLAGASPLILNFSRLYFLDFPQTAMTALAFYFLLKTKRFTNPGFSLLFGAVAALAVLTKWSSLFFLIVPLLYLFILTGVKIFKSGESRIPLSLFLVSAGITASGLLFYSREFAGEVEAGGWLLFYLLIVVAPLLLMKILLSFPLKNVARERGNRALLNFVNSYSIFMIVSCPWYMWTIRMVVWKIRLDTGLQKSCSENFTYILGLINESYTAAPVLMAAGLVFLLMNDLDDSDLLLSAFSGFTLIMTLIGYADNRYLISAVIIPAVLGGFWVAYAGRIKYIMTFLIVCLSIISISAWTLIPGESLFYRPVEVFQKPRAGLSLNSILCSGPPVSRTYHINSIVNKIFANKKDKKTIVVRNSLECRSFSFEMLEWESFKRGKRLQFREIWGRDELSEYLLRDQFGRQVGEFLLVYEDDNVRRNFIEEMLLFSRSEIEEESDYYLGEGFNALFLILKREEL